MTSSRRCVPVGRFSDVGGSLRGRAGAAQFGQALPERAHAARWVGEAARPARPGVGGQRAGAGSGDREPRRLRVSGRQGRSLIHQPGQDREPADAVRQYVVHDDDQAGAAAGEAGDERGRPQRPGPGQRLAGHGGGHLQQRPLIARWQALALPDVVPQVKRRVVGPERPAAAGRRPAQPLPEPGHGADPLAEQPPCFGNIEAWPGAKDQHGADMHGSGTHVRGELHQVGRAGPVHRHRLRGIWARPAAPGAPSWWCA